MQLLLRLTALLALIVTPLHAADLSIEEYGYPLANPFEATIAGTPSAITPSTRPRDAAPCPVCSM